MFATVNVEVYIRKGLGPETVRKVFEQAYDDLPEDTQPEDITRMAITDTERYLYSTEDFPVYGKNWTIGECFLNA